MPAYEELLQENVELRRRVTEQESRIAQLEKIIEELRRGGKRQAAPSPQERPRASPNLRAASPPSDTESALSGLSPRSSTKRLMSAALVLRRLPGPGPLGRQDKPVPDRSFRDPHLDDRVRSPPWRVL